MKNEGDGTETVWSLWLEFLTLRDLLMVLDLYSGNITWIFSGTSTLKFEYEAE